MYPERQLLARYVHTGTISAGQKWSPAAQSTTEPSLHKGLLNGAEVAEIDEVVCWSPVGQGAAAQALDRVRLVLDGSEYEYITLSGRQDTSMAPPDRLVRVGSPLRFGQPVIDPNGNQTDALDALCPKYTNSVSVNAYAGPTNDVTADFTVDIYGYVYDSTDLAKRLPEFVIPNFMIPDPLNNRQFQGVGQTIQSGGDWLGSWKALPAGPGQGIGNATPINPLVRRMRNSNATTANEAYVPQYQNSSDTPAVEYAGDDMYFKLNKRQAILLERLGVVGPAAPNATGNDLLAAWIQTGAEMQKRHPQGGIPAGYNIGSTRFGLLKGQTNRFAGIPFLPQGDQLLTNETAYPTFVDNGTVIAALGVTMAIVGKAFGSSAISG